MNDVVYWLDSCALLRVGSNTEQPLMGKKCIAINNMFVSIYAQALWGQGAFAVRAVKKFSP